MMDYVNCARENELVFRAVLKYLGHDTANMTMDEIYLEFSAGKRMGRFTVVDFEKKGACEYELTYENLGPLSGFMITGLWSYINNELKFIENVDILMS